MESGSWRRGKSLVRWSYELPPPTGRGPAFSLARAALGLVASLGDFGVVRRVRITTRSGGERAVSIESEDAVTAEDLERALDEHRDAEQLFFDLALRVSPDGVAEEWVPDGAGVMISLDWPDPDEPGQGTPELGLSLSLHVDLYAAQTWGVSRENRALSVINAPRLATFLKRLRKEVRATLVDLDKGDYEGQVTADGFAPPSGTTH